MSELEEEIAHALTVRNNAELRKGHLAGYYATVLGAGGLVTAAALLLFSGDDCFQVIVDSQFAASADRFEDRFDASRDCQQDEVNASLLRNVAFVAAYCAALGGSLRAWWNASWDSEPGRSKLPGTVFVAVAGAAVVLSILGAMLTSASLSIGTAQQSLSWPALISALAWAKWLLVFLLLTALVLTFLSWTVRLVTHLFRLVRDTRSHHDYVPENFEWSASGRAGEGELCISLSGGGIRSAAFSLGALSALEDFKIGSLEDQRSILDSAAVLGTVSGGGYAGTAWRIAAGTGSEPERPEPPIIGDPNRYVPTAAMRISRATVEEQGAVLFPRIWERRSFLRNGRGGMASSLIQTLLQLLLHIGLVLWSVGLVAWLVGRFVDSWAITGADGSIEYGRLIRPAGWALLAFALFATPRLFLHPGRARRFWDGLATFWLFVAGALAVGLVVVPWMVVELLDAIEQLLPGGAGPQSTVALALSGGVAASAWRVLQAPIKSRALYLGGVLLAIALVLFAMFVASEAGEDPSNFFFIPGGWFGWCLGVAAFVVALSVLNPELWSLHPIYARLIRGTFGNRLVDGEWTELGRNEWPRLSSYKDAPGPKPLICAAAARGTHSNTGLGVVSMTFEPDCVTVHHGPSSRSERNSVAIETEAYERMFDGRAGAARLQSILGYAAVSAAAIAPSLGRLTLGSTDALIAALNMRLGVWLPNPDYEKGKRRIGPHMINMYKELTGSFGIEEPNLYVTDGGHWENMALVELIRRRAGVIIAVDVSADKPHSFKIIREAVELTRLECGASITFLEGHTIDDMHPGDRPRPDRNWAAAEIVYGKDEHGNVAYGRLLIVKAQSSDAMPLDILRFAKEDPKFPNYSTGNQMLSDKEFGHLAVLGRESMVHAITEHFDWLFEGYRLPTSDPVPPGDALRDAESMSDAESLGDAEPDDKTEPVEPTEPVELMLVPLQRATPTAKEGSALAE